jgi:outer membrane protein assembly factor BamB
MARLFLIGTLVSALLSATAVAYRSLGEVGLANRSLGEGGSVEVRMIEVVGEGAKYWPRWRGPSGQGHVAAGPYTDQWSANTAVWKTAVPGRGNSSPIVWGDRIFLTTGYGQGERLSMLAFSRADGKPLWETFIPQNGVEYNHAKNGFASATPATDGQLVYASFGRHGLVAFDFSGKIVWHHKFGNLDNYHGPAGSPVLYKDRIFIYQDVNPATPPGQSSFVGAFDKKTGKPIWMTRRNETVGWGTAVVINTGERDELIVSSQHRVAAYDPETGKELWTVRGNTYEVIPTPVVSHGLVIASSGRAGPTIAIRPGGAGDVTSSHVAWSSPRGSPFVPSGVVVGDLLYLINDMQSILTVYEAATGKLAYQERLGEALREGFSASPVHVNGKVYFTNDEGQTFVIEAGPKFKLLRVNELGEQTLASPALVDGTWYWRTSSSLRAIR